MGRKSYIWLLAITVLVGAAVVIWLIANSGGIYTTGPRRAYDTIKSQIEDSVTDFAATHNGLLPPCEDTLFDVYDANSKATIMCCVFDICSLIGKDQLLRGVPDGLSGNSSQVHTNFYNSSDAYYNGSCENPCDSIGHYIYLIDSTGNVYSICDENRDGVYNSTDRVDGQHGDIWP